MSFFKVGRSSPSEPASALARLQRLCRSHCGQAGVVDIDSLDYHDSPWLSVPLSGIGELRPTFLCAISLRLTRMRACGTTPGQVAGCSRCRRGPRFIHSLLSTLHAIIWGIEDLPNDETQLMTLGSLWYHGHISHNKWLFGRL